MFGGPALLVATLVPQQLGYQGDLMAAYFLKKTAKVLLDIWEAQLLYTFGILKTHGV